MSLCTNTFGPLLTNIFLHPLDIYISKLLIKRKKKIKRNQLRCTMIFKKKFYLISKFTLSSQKGRDIKLLKKNSLYFLRCCNTILLGVKATRKSEIFLFFKKINFFLQHVLQININLLKKKMNLKKKNRLLFLGTY